MLKVNPVVNFGDAPEARLKPVAKIYYGVNSTPRACLKTLKPEQGGVPLRGLRRRVGAETERCASTRR